MPIEVLMPALSPTMTEGNLAKWHKKEGDAVKAGDILAEIETDKATMEFEAADEGTLGRILVPEGTQAVKVNQPIAVILGEGEDAAALDKAKPAPAKPAAAAARAPAVPGAPLSLPSYGKDQVLALAGNPPYEEMPLTAMRRIIAKRMQEAKATIPHFYLTVDCEIDSLLRMRKEINDNADLKVSVNDFVIKAVALTLMKVPAANASFSEDAILRWKTADIAIAVALDDGLITPIIKHAEQKGVGTIAAEMKDLAARARAGKLKLTEFQRGTFSISNLGMYGIKDFAAVINPPHGGILAVGAGEQRPVVKNGQVAIATIMSCTIACDHRVVDGAVGAQWLQAFKKIIEAPALLAL